MFFPTLQRVTTVAVIRKCYEALALEYLPMKYVDKMTKDLTRSIIRKCDRFPRLVACQKILYTLSGAICFSTSPASRTTWVCTCTTRLPIWCAAPESPRRPYRGWRTRRFSSLRRLSTTPPAQAPARWDTPWARFSMFSTEAR